MSIIMNCRNSTNKRMACRWRKKAKNFLVGRHDKEASSSIGHGRLSRAEKEARATKERFRVLCSEDEINFCRSPRRSCSLSMKGD